MRYLYTCVRVCDAAVSKGNKGLGTWISITHCMLCSAWTLYWSKPYAVWALWKLFELYEFWSASAGAYGPFGNMPGAYGQSPTAGLFGSQIPRASGPIPNNVAGACNMPGGMTPQVANIRQIADLVWTLDGNQTRVLRDMLNERMGNQGRMIPGPEFFGDVDRSQGVPFVADGSRESLIGESAMWW